MKILAIETASEACSAALYSNGDITSRFELAPRRHAELILPMCESLLKAANMAVTDLDALAFGRGPGAFTGVRIATGVIQGMAWAADVPVVPVSSLAAVAHAAMHEHGCEQVAVAMDARMNEVYWGCYQQHNTGVILLGEEMVIAPQKVNMPQGEWFAAGTGWQTYLEELSEQTSEQVIARDAELLPHAGAVAQLAVSVVERGEQLGAEQVIPIYLRDNVAEKKKSS